MTHLAPGHLLGLNWFIVPTIWPTLKGYPHQWHLYNFILGTPGLKNRSVVEIEVFFSQNRNSACEIIIWEAFKTYIRGIFTAFKIQKDKLCNHFRYSTLCEID